MSLSDEDRQRLIDEAKAGSDKAFEKIIESYAAMYELCMTRYLKVSLRQRLKDELIQLYQIETVRCVRNFNPQNAEFTTYLYSCLRGITIRANSVDLKVANKIRTVNCSDPEELKLVDSCTPLQTLIKKEEAENVRAKVFATKALTVREKLVVWFYFFKGEASPEIAEMMGITYQAVLNAKNSACAKLKEVLGSKLEADEFNLDEILVAFYNSDLSVLSNKDGKVYRQMERLVSKCT